MFKVYEIDFAQPEVVGYKLRWKLHTVYQTNSGNIEKHCVEAWPELLGPSHAFSFTELKQLRLMEKYIIDHLTRGELKWVIGNAYVLGWMAPAEESWNALRVVPGSVENVKCTRWENGIPYLDIECVIEVDIIEILMWYAKSGFFRSTFTTTVATRVCDVVFERDLPGILRYSSSPRAAEVVLQAYRRLITKRDNSFGYMYAKYWNIKDMSKYDVHVEYSPVGGFRSYVNGTVKLMIDTVKANPVKTAAALAVAGKILTKVPIGRKKRTIG